MAGLDQTDGELTKHEQLLLYIRELPVGTRISVRQMAKDRGVSEGTAYRALKDAEHLGYVNTKERIGSVRVDKKRRSRTEQLTFAEVLEIVQGDLLGGSEGLDKTLHKFVIGAMELDEMMGYIDAGSLLIVGNRESAHRVALEHGAGVLVTGGFGTSADVKALADERQLPILTCRHDTFTVASMINRAMFDRQIKRKIMTIADLVEPAARTGALRQSASVSDFQKLSAETGFERFPVTDEWNRVVGMITSKDVSGSPAGQTLDKLMTRRPMTVTMGTPIASAAHRMVSEGIELLPVVDRQRKLVGVVSRRELLRSMQLEGKHPELGETFDALMWEGFAERRDEAGRLQFAGLATPQMTGPLGTLSEGVLTVLMQQAAARMANDLRKGEHILQNMTTYFLRTIPIEASIVIVPSVIEASRRHLMMEVQVLQDGDVMARSMLTAQTIDAL
ncbi:DRTGG domain-containing protein [Cohnella lubricantis]|uniref:CBS domain-containing protein n=1 Tax=Cohnella lubricantis TaxID=2163172 RepID=A0A841T7A7_9BACL|nr:DRTGG domain-containing protein [Cohnella lubricantis]MBB6675936.1 CBS domain-containing protein [Cohnella lubricantis]MBP2117948.1 putative transcriptional regulator [Cohnella lubricantis]